MGTGLDIGKKWVFSSPRALILRTGLDVANAALQVPPFVPEGGGLFSKPYAESRWAELGGRTQVRTQLYCTGREGGQLAA